MIEKERIDMIYNDLLMVCCYVEVVHDVVDVLLAQS